MFFSSLVSQQGTINKFYGLINFTGTFRIYWFQFYFFPQLCLLRATTIFQQRKRCHRWRANILSRPHNFERRNGWAREKKIRLLLINNLFKIYGEIVPSIPIFYGGYAATPATTASASHFYQKFGSNVKKKRNQRFLYDRRCRSVSNEQ